MLSVAIITADAYIHTPQSQGFIAALLWHDTRLVPQEARQPRYRSSKIGEIARGRKKYSKSSNRAAGQILSRLARELRSQTISRCEAEAERASRLSVEHGTAWL